MINYNVLNEFVEKLKSAGITPNELKAVAKAFSNDDIQAKLTAGNNVQIENNVISATDTTYTAGTGINITDCVISSTQSSSDTYENDVRIGIGSNRYIDIILYSSVKLDTLSSQELQTYVAQHLGNKKVPCISDSLLTIDNKTNCVPKFIFRSGSYYLTGFYYNNTLEAVSEEISSISVSATSIKI